MKEYVFGRKPKLSNEKQFFDKRIISFDHNGDGYVERRLNLGGFSAVRYSRLTASEQKKLDLYLIANEG